MYAGDGAKEEILKKRKRMFYEHYILSLVSEAKNFPLLQRR